MHVVGQIIDRNLHRKQHCATALWINPDQNDNRQGAKAHCDTLNICSQDYGNFCFLKQAGADVEFSAFPDSGDKQYQWVILNLPRQKALRA